MKRGWSFVWLLVVGIAVAGCGLDDQAEVDRYTGTWSWESGSTIEQTCDGDTNSYSLTGNISILDGSSADLVWAGDECNWEFDIQAGEATIVPGQSCEYSGTTNGTQVDATESWSQWTMSESGDAMSVDSHGTVEYEFPDGSVECTGSSTGTLTRVSG